MRKSLMFILLILFSCQKDELIITEPLPQYEMIFEVSTSKVVDGQEFSFDVSTNEKHTLIISDKNNSTITKESFNPTLGINTKILYIKSLPIGELNLSLINDSGEIAKTTIIVE